MFTTSGRQPRPPSPLPLYCTVREDLLGRAAKICPVVLDYTEMDKTNSLYNTPCTTAVFVLERCLNWVLEKGGVSGGWAVAVM